MKGIKIDPTPLFSTAYFEIGGYEGQLDEEGVVEIDVGCACGSAATLALHVDQLQEIVDAAKKFRDRRAAFVARPTP